MLSISPTFKQKKIKKRSIILRNLGILIKLQYVFVFTILKEKKIQKKKNAVQMRLCSTPVLQEKKKFS